MSAPESVVRAVMDRLGCRTVRGSGCRTHYDWPWTEGWPCPQAEAAADAAYAAALAVLRDLIRSATPEGAQAREALWLAMIEWEEVS